MLSGSFSILLIIWCFHYISDFMLQTRHMSSNKSKSIYTLFTHVAVYSLIMFNVFLYTEQLQILNNWDYVKLYLLISIPHFIVDLVTSKLSSYYFIVKKDYHVGFVIVGFDQLLHLIQMMYLIDFYILTPIGATV